MDKIEQKIKNLEDAELPKGLHGKIMRKILFRHYRPTFFVISSVVVFNLAISAVRIHAKVVESGAAQAFSSFFANFDTNYNFVSDFMGLAGDYLPLYYIGLFFANSLLAIYIFKLYSTLRNYERYERSRLA